MAVSIGAGLADQGVVVTGAAGGVGREVARLFAEVGARVCCVDIDETAVKGLVADLPDPDRHLALALDLRDLDAQEPLLDRVIDTFGSFVALAHLAAVLRRREQVEEVTEEDWDVQLDVNLKATFFIDRAAAGAFRRQRRGGAIVNFSSQGWWTGGFGGSVVYSASKSGVVSMSRGLARSWAADRIRVNVVAPGAFDTPMMRSGMTEQALADFEAMIPMGRVGRPAELAGIVVFLCSDHASYITGATFTISGGQLMY